MSLLLRLQLVSIFTLIKKEVKVLSRHKRIANFVFFFITVFFYHNRMTLKTNIFIFLKLRLCSRHGDNNYDCFLNLSSRSVHYKFKKIKIRFNKCLYCDQIL